MHELQVTLKGMQSEKQSNCGPESLFFLGWPQLGALGLSLLPSLTFFKGRLESKTSSLPLRRARSDVSQSQEHLGGTAFQRRRLESDDGHSKGVWPLFSRLGHQWTWDMVEPSEKPRHLSMCLCLSASSPHPHSLPSGSPMLSWWREGRPSRSVCCNTS